MKTLRFLLMAAAAMFVVVTCDDESMNLDKARIGSISGKGKVDVEVSDSSFQLNWEQPEIYTDKGRMAVAGNSGSMSYNVYLVSANADTSVFITTVDSCGAELSFSDVEKALGQFNNSAQDYKFGVSLTGSNNMLCTSDLLNSDPDPSDKKEFTIKTSTYIYAINVGGGNVYGAGKYTEHEIVELSAEPYEGYEFDAWFDGERVLSHDNPYSYQVTKNATLTAVFKKPVQLNVSTWLYNRDGTGEGSDYRGGKVTGKYYVGDHVTLDAESKEGYVFSCWYYTNRTGNVLISNNSKYDYYVENENTIGIAASYSPAIDKQYTDFNTWFLSGENEPTGSVILNLYHINVKGDVWRDDRNIATTWNDNFEVVFHELENQEVDKDFQLMFNIKWEGEAETAGFRICSGVDKYILEDIDKDWDAWDANQNTELLFDDFDNSMGQTFTVGRGDETDVVWGGKIGERGKDYIGIEINLSGTEKDGVIYENGPGTFTISNMQVLIGGEKVWPESE